MKFFKQFSRFIVLWFIMGICYALVEILFRGFTFLQMIWIGGLCGVLVGLLNEFSAFKARRIWQQSLIGTGITLSIEFISGYIFNIRLSENLWDYSKVPFNFMGQICLRTAIAWFFLMPFTIYLDDWLRWKLFKQKKPSGGPLENYKLLIIGK